MDKHKTIAVLSGKGGTGKTFVSVNLTAIGEKTTYMDCDVEEPNGHLFFPIDHPKIQTIYTTIPKVDGAKCNGCKVCVDFCNFHALAYAGENLMIFDDICHGCKGCILFCPQKALQEQKKQVGIIQSQEVEGHSIVSGIMDEGRTSGVPIIQSMMKQLNKQKTTIIDCPPGSSCLVMESIQKADYCLIVVEPTIFGMHNFLMIHELVDLFEKSFGVVINKSMNEDQEITQYCEKHQIPLLAKIPYDPILAKIHSKGEIVVYNNPSYASLFEKLYQEVIS